MKIILWTIRETLIIYFAVRASSGTPVFQDRGQSLPSSGFSSGYPESHHSGISSHYEGLSSQSAVQQDLNSSLDSAASQSRQERSKFNDSRRRWNQLMTGSSYGSGRNLPISTEDSKLQVEETPYHLGANQSIATSESSDGMEPLSVEVENEEPDRRPLNMMTSFLAQIEKVRDAHEAHMTTTAAMVNLPGVLSPGVVSNLKKLPYEFFVELEYLRQKVYELAEKINKLTSSGQSSSLKEQTERDSHIQLENLLKDSSHPSIPDLDNALKSLGSQLSRWNLATPEPSLLSMEAAINHKSTNGNDSFVNAIRYLRNEQTRGTSGHKVISEELNAASPVDERDHITNSPDNGSGVTYKDLKVRDPNIKPIDKLKAYLDKVASKEENYVDTPVQFFEGKDIIQDPDRYLKLSEELTKQEKIPTCDEACRGNIPDPEEDTDSSDVVLDSTILRLSVPDVKPVSKGPIVELATTNLADIPITTDAMEPTTTEPTSIKHITSDSDLKSTIYVPINVNPGGRVLVDLETTSTNPFSANFESPDSTVFSESDLKSTIFVPINVNPGDRVPVDLETTSTNPVTANVAPPESAIISGLNLKSTTHGLISMNPGDRVLVDLETTSTNPVTANIAPPESTIISGLDLKSTTHGLISMNPGDRVPVDLETTTSNLVSANVAPLDSTIISETDLKSTIYVPINVNLGDRVPVDLETTSTKPVNANVASPDSTVISESDLKSTIYVPVNVNPGDRVPVDLETTSINPVSANVAPPDNTIISESNSMSTTHGPISMNPGDRVPVDLETTTSNPVSANVASPDSTIMVHVPTEPPVTYDSNPDAAPTVIIATPVTHTSLKPSTAVQETTVTISDDQQIASKIAREEVDKIPVQYHDHTVLLAGLLVAGLACVMVVVGASILCHVQHRKKKIKEQVESGFKSRYTRHNTLARQ